MSHHHAYDDVVTTIDASAGVALRVSFGGVAIAEGAHLACALAAPEPTVEIIAPKADPASVKYTFLCVDPDAPDPAAPTMREILHHLVVNVPGDGHVDKGHTVVSYIGPAPRAGRHRYICLAYEQPAGRDLEVPPAPERRCFTTAEWTKAHGLGAPVAAMLWYSEKEAPTAAP